MEWFTSRRLTEHLTRITDITGVYMYLVTGKEKALLIDTGCGLGDLAKYVQGLTSLPLTVVCSHGHMDHAGGAAQFSKVYLNPKDVELSLEHCSEENRKEYAGICLRTLHPEIDPLEAESWVYQPVRREAYEPLLDKMKFELGEMTVQAFAMKGHTKGCMCMLFMEERSILLGDACNPSTFLFDKETVSVEEYQKSMQAFRHYEELYDTVWISHGDGNSIPKEILAEGIRVCQEIMEGRDDKEEFCFMGGIYKAAHAMTPSQLRKDGGLANIIYNDRHIWQKQ